MAKPRSGDDLVGEMRARLALAESADSQQDKRERDDLSFYEGEGQWPEEIRTARAGQSGTAAGVPPVPPRPCLTITGKIREPILHVLNEEREADLGIEVVPADDFVGLARPIDDTEITLREGLIRRIQRQHGARDARTWAFKRSTIAGRGYYGLMTRYVDGKTNDQEIYYRRFYNQSAVKLDPAHEMPDGSDAEWAIIGSYMAWDRYQAEYPRNAENHPNQLLGTGEDFDTLSKDDPDWFVTEGTDNSVRMVRIVEYWYVAYSSRELVTLNDGSVLWADEAPPSAEIVDRRDVLERAVRFAKLDGRQVLESTDWPGKFIPVIKVIGEEIVPFDTQRRAEGMVRPARDAVKGFNVMVSSEVEVMGLLPKSPVELDPEQIEGFEDIWKEANTRNWAYLPRKSFALNGQPYPPITYLQREPPIQGLSMLVGQFDQFVKSSTGIPDPTLGNVDPSIRSGRGIKALLAQSQQGTSHYLDNLVRSEHYEARILNDLLPAIYGRPGRLVRIVNGQMNPEALLLHQPMVSGPTGQPMAFDPAQHQGQQSTTYTLTKDANFNVAVKVSRSFDTRRQEIEQTLTELVQADPERMLPFYADLLWKYSDVPGHEEFEERGKLMLAPAVQAMLNKDTPIPPQAQAHIAQLTQQNQQLMQVLSTKQAETQGKLQVAQVQESAENQRTQAELATKVQVAQIQQEGAFAIASLKAQLEAVNTALQALQAERAALKENVQTAQADHHVAQQIAHETAQNQLDRAHDLVTQAVGHQQALAQQPREPQAQPDATGQP